MIKTVLGGLIQRQLVLLNESFAVGTVIIYKIL